MATVETLSLFGAGPTTGPGSDLPADAFHLAVATWFYRRFAVKTDTELHLPAVPAVPAP